MTRRESEADRLRRCREQFERACADNVTMDEAKRRIALDRLEATMRRARPADPAPIARPVSSRPLPLWYQQEPYV